MKTESRIIRALLGMCVLLQLVFFVLAWSALIAPGQFMQFSARELSAATLHAMTLPQRAVGAALGLPALAALCYGLWRLQAALRNVERNAVFDLATIAHVRAFAGAALVSTMWTIIEVPLRAWVLRHAMGMQGLSLQVGVSGDQLLLILVCALFYLITRMMHEGRRLAEENEAFV